MRDLDAIQARADAATPGPWYARSPQQPFQIVSDTANICGIHDGGQTYDSCLANARFIAYARDYVPALVAELRAARAERDQLSHDATETRRKFGMAQATNISLMAELRAAREVIEIARHADAPGLRAAIHAYDYAMRDED